jgi:pilus assembly protein Flp/PilA
MEFTMFSFLKSTTVAELLRDESGATAIEYGLIAALVSVAAIAAMQALGGSLNTVFSTASATVSDAASGIGVIGGGGEDEPTSNGQDANSDCPSEYECGPNGEMGHRVE